MRTCGRAIPPKGSPSQCVLDDGPTELPSPESAGPTPQKIQMVAWCVCCHETFPLRGHFWHLSMRHRADPRWHEACGSAFTTVQDAERHKQGCRAGFEVLQCSFCGGTFDVSIDRFQRHLAKLHKARLKDDSNYSGYLLMIEAPGFPTVYSGVERSLLKEESDRFEYRLH